MRPSIESDVRIWTRKVSRLTMATVFTLAATIEPIFAQAPAAPTPSQAPQLPQAPSGQNAQQVYSMTDLEYLLGPIALFPDPLLALVLPASTFPLQIVQADRWLAANPEAVKQNDFSQADGMGWDASVQGLLRFPSVIEMLADHLNWTESLGEAFTLQPADVAAAVQVLRAKAQSIGNLKSTPEQQVVTRDEGGAQVIYIEPAAPERIYVPVYDSSAVFYSALPAALLFGTAVVVGSTWNSRWGWHNRRWNDVWIHQPTWNVNVNRPRPPSRPGAWRPDRPGNRPDRPGVGGPRPPRPDRPVVRPDRPGGPGGRPDLPGLIRPDRPGGPGGRPGLPGANRPDRPGDRPGVGRPDRPGFAPDRPGSGANRPGGSVGAERPNVRPDRPGGIQRPSTGLNRPNVGGSQRPNVRPDRPAAGPNRPAANRPNIQRPQARPQPRPQARSPQARPQARPQPTARPQQRPQARPQPQRPRPPQGGGNRNPRGGN